MGCNATLLAIAYPEWAEPDRERIERCRKAHDRQFSVVGPHFTFVFPVSGIDPEEFTVEIRTQLAGFGPIPFCLRCATVNRDALSGEYHVFLVPDEGYGEMERLHDRLYAGLLSPHHRMDLGFTPHVTVATHADALVCKQVADEWNAEELAIAGVVSSIDIVDYTEGEVKTIAQIALAGVS